MPLSSLTLSLSFPCCVSVMKQRTECPQVTPLWAHRAPASPCTPLSLRARGESPSSIAPTPTTTCHLKRSHETPPWPAKGETRGERQRERERACCVKKICRYFKMNSLSLSLSVPPSLRHTAEDFIVTPFAQVSHNFMY